MKKTNRNILIILGVIAFVLVGIIGLGIYSIYSIFTSIESQLNRPIPSELKEPKVLVGNDFLVKKELYKLKEFGYLNTIIETASIKDEKQREAFTQSRIARSLFGFSDLKVFGNEIIAVGGFVFELNGELKGEIQFEPSEEKIKISSFEKIRYKLNLANLQIVPLTKDKYGFLSYGYVDGATVYDENGKIIWAHAKEDLDFVKILSESEEESAKSFEERTYVLEAAVGDLDNDEISEFIVSNKNIGIQAFNQKGEKLWLAENKHASDKLVVADIDNDGENELIELASKIRDKNGKVIKELKNEDSANSVFFC